MKASTKLLIEIIDAIMDAIMDTIMDRYNVMGVIPFSSKRGEAEGPLNAGSGNRTMCLAAD